MFDKVFVEKEYASDPLAKSILERFSKSDHQIIDQYTDVFGQVKKPYLQKRDKLNLFLGKKRGQLLKEAPDAYGLAGEPHYYFIHAYNCIYECEYCYLQGYFHSPDIVIFLNKEEIAHEIIEVGKQGTENKKVWFHAGEFSDSLALSHITDEIAFYYETFAKLPHALLELRTKSVNIKKLLELGPRENIITSFSLSPDKQAKTVDRKVPSIKARISAMKQLIEKGHKVALHLDPIIYGENFENEFYELFQQLGDAFNLNKLDYLSLGVVRFTKDVYQQVEKNYPDSIIHHESFSKSFDGKVRYQRPMRLWMLGKVKNMAISSGLDEDKIYLCME